MVGTRRGLAQLSEAEVTGALIPLLTGDQMPDRLRVTVVSEVAPGNGLELVVEDPAGSRRRYRLAQLVEVHDTWPFHYRDDGRWCPHSGSARGERTSCPFGCAGSAEASELM